MKEPKEVTRRRVEAIRFARSAVGFSRRFRLGAVTIPPDVFEELASRVELPSLARECDPDGVVLALRLEGVEIKPGGPKRWK